jgi:hypothetical protein
MLQGFLTLLAAFLFGLPLGDLLARQVRRRLKRPRPQTERVLAMMAGATPAPSSPAGQPLPQSAPLIYPVSAFGQTTISRPVRTDHEAPL